jgi:exodeoxyribonuclease VII small subunit
MAKKKPEKKANEPDIRLEDAMNELQEIVGSLESGQEPLDDSLAKFERGMELLRVCHRQLEHAAQRIEIVTRVDANGNFQTKDFDGASTLDRTADVAGGDARSKLF